jgi:hypothetical protein
MFSAKPFNLRYLVSLVEAASCWLLATGYWLLAAISPPECSVVKRVFERVHSTENSDKFYQTQDVFTSCF